MLKEEGVAAVERALSILSAWREGEGALPLRELHKRTGLYKSTILRLLASLERFRCVVRRPSGDWALGPTVFQWGTAFQRSLDFEPTVPDHLTRLADASGESTTFWVRNGSQRLCLFRADAAGGGSAAPRPGDLRPLDEGVSGAVLANGEQVLEDGVVVGVTCLSDKALAMSAPIFGADGELRGVLTLFGPYERMLRRMEDIRSMVRDAAAGLSEALGTKQV